MRVVCGHQPLRWRTWVSDGYNKGQSSRRTSIKYAVLQASSGDA